MLPSFVIEGCPLVSASHSMAYLLVSHGSRDPRPQAAMNRLAQLVRDQLRDAIAIDQPNCPEPRPAGSTLLESDLLGLEPQSRPHPGVVTAPAPASAKLGLAGAGRDSGQPYPLVGTAYLEAAPLPLHQQIYEFCLRVKAAGVEQVTVIPVFLLQGVHVMEDIPREIALAREQLAGRMSIEVSAHLGSHAGLGRGLRAKLAATAAEFRLILAHGSRQPGGNRSVEVLAESLGATAAFWSVPPGLETQVVKLIQAGCQRLTILPYFLFTGGTTDAITRLTEELAERFPKIEFRLLPPLGATAELAQLTTEIALNQASSAAGAAVQPMKRVAWRQPF